METANAMNYKQNKLALALKSGKSYNVGVIVPRLNRNFFSTVINGIEDELYPHGYHVIICQTYDLKEREIDNINTLLNAQVDGIFMSISNATTENSELKRIVDKNVPLIFFDRKKDIDGVSSVVINDFEGGYIATEHLIKTGCKNIVHLAGDKSLDIYKNRLEGYRQALLDYHLVYDENNVIEAPSKVEAGQKVVDQILDLKKVPDAIFSSSDFVALGVIQELRSRGYKIPDDISVVGFSNEPFTKFLELTISSVDQAPYNMGKIAAQVFLEKIADSSKKIEKKVVLTPTLLIRKSSAKKVEQKDSV